MFIWIVINIIIGKTFNISVGDGVQRYIYVITNAKTITN